MQSNVEGALSVVLIQGFTALSAIVCCQLAQRGMTGPKSFLTGTFGYFHLFNKEKYNVKSLIGELGNRFELINTVFKRYPSCGLTQSSTAGILRLIKEKSLTAEDVERVDISVEPFVYKMVGQPYEVGENPKLNAQYSIPFCVANALFRKGSRLKHFDESSIREPEIMLLTKKIHVTGAPELENRGLRAMDMKVRTKNGEVHFESMDYGLLSPESKLSEEEHMSCFQDCINYGGKPLPSKNIDRLVSSVNEIEMVEDIRSLIPLLISE
jgi:2-methylcitrate dehydratase PrpD